MRIILILLALISMAGLYNAKGDYEKALEYYMKSLSIELNSYGKKHRRLVTTYYNIGLVCKAKGDLEKSLEYHLKSLSLKLEIFKENHPDVAFPTTA